MVALIAENARVGFLEKQTCQIPEFDNCFCAPKCKRIEKQTCQIPEFDNDLVRRLIASIKVVSVEKLIIQF